ncbi:MAG: hypothetical protein HY814_09165 [Candidatus Riflebacteria bacterium]|nr:hypothetical protein [Candidatus Riflebacteria bacterium]
MSIFATPEACRQAEASSALVLGLSCLLALAWLPAYLERREPDLLDLVPVGLLAVSTCQVAGTGGSLEAILQEALLLGAFWAFAVETRKALPVPASAVLLALASLAGPHGAAYALAALPAVWTTDQRGWRGAVEWAAVFCAPFLAYQAWRWLYFGVLGPSGPASWAGAPWSGQSGPTWPGLAELAAYGERFWPAYLAAMFVVGIAVAWRRPAGLFACGCVLVGVTVTATGDLPPGQNWRLLVPALPALYLLFGAGLRRTIEFLYSPDTLGLRRDLPTAGAFVLVGLVCLRQGVASLQDLRTTRTRSPEHATRGLQRGKAFAELAARAGFTGATLAETRPGLAAWASGLEVVDLSGRTDRTLARFGSCPSVRDAYLFEQRRPTFVRLSDDWRETTGLAGVAAIERTYVTLPSMPGDRVGDRNLVRRDVFVAAAGEHPEFTLGSCFESEITLAGATRVARTAAPGGKVELLLYWSALTPSVGVHSVEVALSGADRHTSAHPLALGWLPASLWGPDERVRERVMLELPAAAAEGDYQVVVSVRNEKGKLLGTTAPPGCRIAISREGARRLCLESLEALKTSPSTPLTRSQVWHHVRQMELAAAATEAEMRRARLHGSEHLARRGLLELSWPEASDQRKVLEAIACLVQTRAWDSPAPELETELVRVLRERADRAEEAGDALAAARDLTLAARVSPSNRTLGARRDAVWTTLAATGASHSAPRSNRPQPVDVASRATGEQVVQ